MLEKLEPSVAGIDSQSVATSEPCGSRGYEGGKNIARRKRNIAFDTLGLLLVVTVTIASLNDAHAACPVMKQISLSRQPRLQLSGAASKHQCHALNSRIAHQKNLTWKLEVIRVPQE